MIQFESQYKSWKIKNVTKLKAWLTSIIKGENKEIESITYIFVSDEELLKINNSSLGHNYYTDIITFPYSYTPIHTEMYISIDRVKDHAKTYNVSFDQELHRVMAHGLLHMCGYDDKTKGKKMKMTGREDHWLAKLEG